MKPVRRTCSESGIELRTIAEVCSACAARGEKIACFKASTRGRRICKRGRQAR